MSLQIRNGLLVDPVQGTVETTDLFIAEGVIQGRGEKPADMTIEQVIDASDRYVMPGLIDCQARMRDPGQPEKANIESETRAAIANGITSLCIPPDTQPPIDNSATVELIHHRTELYGSQVHVYPIGALTRGLGGEQLSNMFSLQGNGCIAFSNALKPLASNLVQRRAMDYAAGQDALVLIQPMDLDLLANGCAHEGAIATRLGLPAIPEAAETAALARDIELVAEMSPCPGLGHQFNVSGEGCCLGGFRDRGQAQPRGNGTLVGTTVSQQIQVHGLDHHQGILTGGIIHGASLHQVAG